MISLLFTWSTGEHALCLWQWCGVALGMPVGTGQGSVCAFAGTKRTRHLPIIQWPSSSPKGHHGGGTLESSWFGFHGPARDLLQHLGQLEQGGWWMCSWIVADDLISICRRRGDHLEVAGWLACGSQDLHRDLSVHLVMPRKHPRLQGMYLWMVGEGQWHEVRYDLYLVWDWLESHVWWGQNCRAMLLWIHQHNRRHRSTWPGRRRLQHWGGLAGLAVLSAWLCSRVCMGGVSFILTRVGWVWMLLWGGPSFQVHLAATSYCEAHATLWCRRHSSQLYFLSMLLWAQRWKQRGGPCWQVFVVALVWLCCCSRCEKGEALSHKSLEFLPPMPEPWRPGYVLGQPP